MVLRRNSTRRRCLFYATFGNSDDAQNILKVVKKELYDGIPTYEIFKVAFRELKKVRPAGAARYDLKNGLLRLGIEGFSFEKLIKQVLEKEGYQCEIDKVIQGKIITHEIDVVAKKGTETVMVECKHHDQPWKADHIHTALYVYARFLDVKEKFSRPALVTNTKFTPQVITYARGVGLQLLGWSYPRDGTLQDLLEKHKLYPVTMLKSLTKSGIALRLAEGIVTIQDVKALSLKDFAKC